MNNKEVPFGYIKDEKIYLKGWADHSDREIGEVREQDESSSVTYFVNKYNELAQKIADLEETITNSVNKGSFLMKLVHLKESLPTHDGLGDYQTLFESLSRQEALLIDIIAKNREKNTEVKKALIQEMKEAVEVINWQEATEKVHEIKSRWIKTGNASDEFNESMEEEFWSFVSAFFERKKAFYEDKKHLFAKRKEGYETLVKEAEGLVDLSGRERFEKVKDLKARWEDLGNIPKTEYSGLARQFTYYLKRKKNQHDPTFDLKGLVEKLKGYMEDKKDHYHELESIRKGLYKLRPMDHESRSHKREALKLVQLLLERDFLEKLATRRFKEFDTLDSFRKKNIRLGILEELIKRDKIDLAKFQENSENFSSSNDSMRSMVEKKLANQQSKILIKEELMNIIKES